MPTKSTRKSTDTGKLISTSTEFSLDRAARILLLLWESETPQPESKLKARLKSTGDFQAELEQLVADGKVLRSDKQFSLSEAGKQQLGDYLTTPDAWAVSRSDYDKTVVGSWVARALCKWIQQAPASVSTASPNGKAEGEAITSYEEFKEVALEVYDRLNQDYNYDDLIPIYRIRRTIGDRVSRAEFNEWMLEMQALSTGQKMKNLKELIQ